MFGIFDKPRTAIRKRIPVNALLEFAAVETLADMRLKNEAIDGFQREAAVGFALSVWACNSAVAGKFPLTDFTYRYVQNLGINYGCRMEPRVSATAQAVMRELVEKGIVSH